MAGPTSSGEGKTTGVWGWEALLWSDFPWGKEQKVTEGCL